MTDITEHEQLARAIFIATGTGATTVGDWDSLALADREQWLNAASCFRPSSWLAEYDRRVRESVQREHGLVAVKSVVDGIFVGVLRGSDEVRVYTKFADYRYEDVETGGSFAPVEFDTIVPASVLPAGLVGVQASAVEIADAKASERESVFDEIERRIQAIPEFDIEDSQVGYGVALTLKTIWEYARSFHDTSEVK